jgi:hypothetical protein
MRFKPTAIEWCVIVSIIGVLIALLLPGPDFDATHRYPAAIPTSESNLADLAGEYLIERKYGARHLSILADGRYSAFHSACTGVGSRESGYVRRAGTSYVLSPATAREGLRERVFLAIRWESRCYLIPPDRMEEFCDVVISGDEPRDGGGGTFFLLAPREPVVGIPDLPEQWANYLKDNLVIARIIEVRDGGLVKIDAGKSNGVPTAHGVLAVQGRGRYHPIRLFVTSVADDTSIARLPDSPSQAPPLAVGQYVVLRK